MIQTRLESRVCRGNVWLLRRCATYAAVVSEPWRSSSSPASFSEPSARETRSDVQPAGVVNIALTASNSNDLRRKNFPVAKDLSLFF